VRLSKRRATASVSAAAAHGACRESQSRKRWKKSCAPLEDQQSSISDCRYSERLSTSTSPQNHHRTARQHYLRHVLQVALRVSFGDTRPHAANDNIDSDGRLAANGPDPCSTAESSMSTPSAACAASVEDACFLLILDRGIAGDTFRPFSRSGARTGVWNCPVNHGVLRELDATRASS
jgi:hypothetical protein